MWLEALESMIKYCDWEDPAFSAWHLSSSSVFFPRSGFLAPLEREILLCSRSIDIWSMVFFIHWFSGWFPLLRYENLDFSNLLCVSFLEHEASSKGFYLSLGLKSVFFFSLPLFFPFYYTFLFSPAKRAWFLEALRDPICISLSCSWIRYYVKESRDVIHQLGFVSLAEWKVDTNTHNSGWSLLTSERTNCSSFLSIAHWFHCITKD